MNKCIIARRGTYGGWGVYLEKGCGDTILLSHYQDVHQHSAPCTPPGYVFANADAVARGRWFDVPVELVDIPSVNTEEIAAIADNIAKSLEDTIEQLRRSATFLRDQHGGE